MSKDIIIIIIIIITPTTTTIIREIKRCVLFPANGRERHLTWRSPRLPFAGRCFNARRTFSRLEETRKREYLQPICTDYSFILIACFYSYSSFIILLLYVLFVKLKEFQTRAKKDDNYFSLYIFSSHCEVSIWRSLASFIQREQAASYWCCTWVCHSCLSANSQ